ncbi:MAG TPA: BON domain-containing protein, partial [Rhabdochlamydiaceae bacterium]|nr:BON domain-containing protein [Rhabdochlamydiaceae bacterium]
MKSLLLIPAMCLLCFACNPDGRNNKNGAQSQEHSADWTITAKVKAAIMADASLSAAARFVSVNTKNGVVTLTGTVPPKEDSDRIVKIAQNVSGVV